MKATADKKYKPSEIADMRLITSTGRTWNGHYKYIMRLIKSGKLKAINYSTGARAQYVVLGSEINRFNRDISS